MSDDDVPVDESDEADEADDDGPVFGRFDAATLLAVEGANGGEWAGLGQVLVTFHVLFREWPDPDDFAESCRLLGAAGLVACEGDGLGLLPPGRKLLRRSGRDGSPSRPAKVAALLSDFDEGDLAEVGEDAGPSGEQVAAARSQLTDDVREDYVTLQASNQARLVGPPIVLPGGIASGAGPNVAVDLGAPDAPAEDVWDWDDLDDGEDPAEWSAPEDELEPEDDA